MTPDRLIGLGGFDRCFNPFKNLLKRSKHCLITAAGRFSFGNHVDIPGVFQRAAILPEVLAREALEAIARRGIANFSADRYTDAAAGMGTGFEESDEQMTPDFLRLVCQVHELGSREQPIGFGEAVIQRFILGFQSGHCPEKRD